MGICWREFCFTIPLKILIDNDYIHLKLELSNYGE